MVRGIWIWSKKRNLCHLLHSQIEQI